MNYSEADLLVYTTFRHINGQTSIRLCPNAQPFVAFVQMRRWAVVQNSRPRFHMSDVKIRGSLKFVENLRQMTKNDVMATRNTKKLGFSRIRLSAG